MPGVLIAVILLSHDNPAGLSYGPEGFTVWVFRGVLCTGALVFEDQGKVCGLFADGECVQVHPFKAESA